MDIKKVEQFWNNRPCNIKHSDKPIGTKQYFDEVEKRKYFVESHIPEFADFKRWKGKKVLEIGCGIGTDSINFAREGANITCVELSEKSLELCKARFQVYGLDARFILSDASLLSEVLKGEKFDLVYSFGVVHHSPDPKAILKKIKEFCHEDTEIRIMVYSLYSYKTIEAWLKQGWKFKFNPRKAIQYYAEAQLGCPVAFTYSKKELFKLFDGYNILSLKKDHIFPYVIKHYIKKTYKKRWFFEIMPEKLFKWLESKLGWHWLIVVKNQKK